MSVTHFNMQLPTLSKYLAILMGKQTAAQSQLVITNNWMADGLVVWEILEAECVLCLHLGYPTEVNQNRLEPKEGLN